MHSAAQLAFHRARHAVDEMDTLALMGFAVPVLVSLLLWAWRTIRALTLELDAHRREAATLRAAREVTKEQINTQERNMARLNMQLRREKEEVEHQQALRERAERTNAHLLEVCNNQRDEVERQRTRLMLWRQQSTRLRSSFNEMYCKLTPAVKSLIALNEAEIKEQPSDEELERAFVRTPSALVAVEDLLDGAGGKFLPAEDVTLLYFHLQAGDDFRVSAQRESRRVRISVAPFADGAFRYVYMVQSVDSATANLRWAGKVSKLRFQAQTTRGGGASATELEKRYQWLQVMKLLIAQWCAVSFNRRLAAASGPERRGQCDASADSIYYLPPALMFRSKPQGGDLYDVQYVYLEPFIQSDDDESEFEKFTNNEAFVDPNAPESVLAFGHFSHAWAQLKWGAELMVSDLQGFRLRGDRGVCLTDPAINVNSKACGSMPLGPLLGTAEEWSKEDDNMQTKGIRAFLCKHECNEHCDTLGVDSMLKHAAGSSASASSSRAKLGTNTALSLSATTDSALLKVYNSLENTTSATSSHASAVSGAVTSTAALAAGIHCSSPALSPVALSQEAALRPGAAEKLTAAAVSRVPAPLGRHLCVCGATLRGEASFCDAHQALFAE